MGGTDFKWGGRAPLALPLATALDLWYVDLHFFLSHQARDDVEVNCLNQTKSVSLVVTRCISISVAGFKILSLSPSFSEVCFLS